MRLTLIHHPGAGGNSEDDPTRLVRILEEAGHVVRYESAEDERWKLALEAPADLVVAAGGDGTVGRVARRMVGRGVPVALLPSGTANNIARSLGVHPRPFHELIRAWRTSRPAEVDVGVAAGPWGTRYFLEGVGCGLFARHMARTLDRPPDPKPDAVLDRLDELRVAAERCEPLELRLALDGRDLSGGYLMVEVLNLRYVGPNLHLGAPRLFDGMLEVVLVRESERPQLLRSIDLWRDRRDRPAALPTLRGRRLELEWTGFALHVDDKVHPDPDRPADEMAGRVEARMEGDSIEFLLPSTTATRALSSGALPPDA